MEEEYVKYQTLTSTQKKLFLFCKQYTGKKNPIKYDILKSLVLESGEFKNFDNSFNALLFKGYFEPVDTDDYSNKFKPTI